MFYMQQERAVQQQRLEAICVRAQKEEEEAMTSGNARGFCCSNSWTTTSCRLGQAAKGQHYEINIYRNKNWHLFNQKKNGRFAKSATMGVSQNH
uniref:Uncharacterized protein n=1 Tax=Globodera rostochiensis TaxID=31243 RepID=A0A914HCI1_GLORO